MKSKIITISLILIALICGGASIYLTNKYISSTIDEEKEIINEKYKPVEVVVASFNLNPGDVISPDTVSVRSVPSGFVHSSAIKRDDFSSVNGFVLSNSLNEGEVLLTSHISQHKGNGFSSLIPEGRRAITLDIDQLGSIDGMLLPGDLVDLYYLKKISLKINGKEKEDTKVFPFLESVEVLATGQRVSRLDSGESITFATVTVNVTSKDAAKILLAKREGEITYALRGPAQDKEFLSDVITESDIFSLPEVTKKKVVSYKPRVEFIIGGQN
jgi:pilus assembly protein CpaB